MDARVRKLTILGVDNAQDLVDAGLDSPRKIKAASNKELEAVKGVGKTAREKLRERFG